MAFINRQAPSGANAEVTEADLRAALNRIVRDSLPPVSIGLGLHYIVFAVKHALTLSQPAAGLMCLASGSAAVILFGFRLALRRWSVPERWVYPVVTMMATLLLFTNFLHLNLVSEPHQTTNLIAVIMGAGFVALSGRWLVLLIIVIWIGWGATVWMSPPFSAWLYYAFALFAATVVAVIIHTVRVRALLRFETLRVQNQIHTQALEAALAAKEISQMKLREMEAQLRRYATELEKMIKERTQRIRELEKQRIESEKLAATGRMAARIAHEINNPLGGIQAAFRLVSGAVPAEHRYHHYVGKIEREIDRISRIMRQMLELHKPHVEAPKAFRPDVTIAEVLALLKPQFLERHVEFKPDLARAAKISTLPENMLRQILYNVILNAMEASPQGGLILVSAQTDEQNLEIAVADHGEGIPEEIKTQMFEPFFTTKSNGSTGGLGLGLSICKNLVEAMNGAITFDSTPGEGTICRVSIPLEQAEAFEKA